MIFASHVWQIVKRILNHIGEQVIFHFGHKGMAGSWSESKNRMRDRRQNRMRQSRPLYGTQILPRLNRRSKSSLKRGNSNSRALRGCGKARLFQETSYEHCTGWFMACNVLITIDIMVEAAGVEPFRTI